MARYPQGVRSYISQIQPFQSDFTFLAAALKGKQNAYDRNYQALNKLYGKIYYADLSHEDNKEKQQQLVKEIDFNLNRVAGLDLSLDKNVQAAKQIFQPFYEDKNLLYDIAATSNVKGSIAGAKSLQSSTKEEEYGQYWKTGIDKLNYKLAEFKETPVDQLQSTGLAGETYTPYVNVKKIAMDYAKDLGVEMENLSWSPDGRYRITTTNGTAVQEPLAQMFESLFGSDPRVQEVYQTQAYVDRKNASYGNAANFGGDKDAAEMDYLKDKYEYLKQRNLGRQMQLENQSTVYNNALKVLQTKYDKSKDPAILNSIEQLKYNKGIVDKSLSLSKASFSVSSDDSTLTTTGGFVNPYGDVNTLRRRVDAGMANSLMGADLNEAAANFAKVTQKIDIEKDEYKYLEVEQAYYDRRHQATIKANKEAATKKFNRDIKLKDIENKLESGAYEITYDEVTGIPNIRLSDAALYKSVMLGEGGVAENTDIMEFVDKTARDVAGTAIQDTRVLLELVQSEIKAEHISSAKVKEALGMSIYEFSEKLNADAILFGDMSPGEKESFSSAMGNLKELVTTNFDVFAGSTQKVLSEKFNALEKFNAKNTSVTVSKQKMANAITEAALSQGYYGAQHYYDKKGNERGKEAVAASLLSEGMIIRKGELVQGRKIINGRTGEAEWAFPFDKDNVIEFNAIPAIPLGKMITFFGGAKLAEWAFGDDRGFYERLDEKMEELSTNKFVVGQVPIPFAHGNAYGGLGALTSQKIELFPGAKTPGYQDALYAKADIMRDPTNIGNVVSIKGNGKNGKAHYNGLSASDKSAVKKALASLTEQFFVDMRSSKNKDLQGSYIQYNNMFANDISQGSITIKPSLKWLRDYSIKAPDADKAAGGIGLLNFEEGSDVAINGITWAMPIDEFKNPVHQQRTGDAYKNYIDVMEQPFTWVDTDTRFKATISKNDLGLGGYEINYNIPFFNPQTGQYEEIEQTDNLSVGDDGFGLTKAIDAFQNTIYNTYKPFNKEQLEIYNASQK